jgi:RNA polymerase sigma factor (sigma-70 family)
MSAPTLEFGPREWDLAYRVALRILKTPDQAEDAAQDALLAAYTARDRFAGRARPSSWLYRIAYNTALTHLRRPFRRRYLATDVTRALEARDHDQPQDDPETQTRAARLAGAVHTCLEAMRPKDRLAFTERFLLGSTERELGYLLGVNTNAAKQRAFRARRAVRTHLTAVGLAP